MTPRAQAAPKELPSQTKDAGAEGLVWTKLGPLGESAFHGVLSQKRRRGLAGPRTGGDLGQLFTQPQATGAPGDGTKAEDTTQISVTDLKCRKWRRSS